MPISFMFKKDYFFLLAVCEKLKEKRGYVGLDFHTVFNQILHDLDELELVNERQLTQFWSNIEAQFGIVLINV